MAFVSILPERGSESMNRIDLDQVKREPIQGHTSKGDQPKWQSNGRWYKADHMGYEALSEVLIAGLLEKSNVKDFVRYQPVEIVWEGKLLKGCESVNFRKKDEMLIPFERLHRAYKGEGLARTLARMSSTAERIQYTVDFVEGVTGLETVGRYITTLLELDSLFLNEDRHTNNLAVIRNEKTLAYRLCPIFDNGLALLSDLNDYPLSADIYGCIGKVQAKPFDRDFLEQVTAAEAIYGSQIKLSFTRKEVSGILSEMIGMYSDEILGRVERVVFEQMRKYPVYF